MLKQCARLRVEASQLAKHRHCRQLLNHFLQPPHVTAWLAWLWLRRANLYMYVSLKYESVDAAVLTAMVMPLLLIALAAPYCTDTPAANTKQHNTMAQPSTACCIQHAAEHTQMFPMHGVALHCHWHRVRTVAAGALSTPWQLLSLLPLLSPVSHLQAC